jgi:histidinol-phosphate/aromatic aminotransferase/cobyric acid decarboxylase-like protein/GNAT superfamily N-acetyltransferase
MHMKTAVRNSTGSRRRDVGPIVLALASTQDRHVIYRLRHEVYARELGQHDTNLTEQLQDPLDDWNIYLVAKVAGEIAGFVSITPPARPAYSINKYFAPERLPFTIDNALYEVRLLTIRKPHRGRGLASLLMYGALRWVEAHGGTRIVVIGRRDLVDLYRRVGLQLTGHSTRAGAVTYDLMLASTTAVRQKIGALGSVMARLEAQTAWYLPFPFRQPAPCFHGGAFFSAIGEQFQTLERHQTVINADVLDAWFPPAPGAIAAVQEYLPWLLRTSPPTGCEGLLEAIAQARGVTAANLLPGAGSSDLIFRALRHWLTPASRALILDPTYGEYAHVLERVIGCTVDRLPLHRAHDFDLDVARLEAALAQEYDLVGLVNPNSPTGRLVPRADLERVLREAPLRTRIWVDETYIEYAGPGQSLEQFAAGSENVLVCKSMSKVYALSGARVAYLCAGPHQLEGLRAITPPWVISLPAQVAAVGALKDPDYYAARYDETRVLRQAVARELCGLGLAVLPGSANFLLCFLPAHGPDAETVVQRCRAQGLFLRNAALMGPQLGTHALRLAVKDGETNRRIVDILGRALLPA